MNTVRHSSKTTVTLILFLLSFAVIKKWWYTGSIDAIYYIQHMLSNQFRLEPVFRVVLNVSFWSLVIVGVEYAIIDNLFGLKVLQAFTIPLTISVIVAIAANIPVIGFYWFWGGYCILLIGGIKKSFEKLVPFNCGSNKLIPFLKGIRKQPVVSGNAIDFYAVYATKIVLSALFVLMVLLLTIFCITNRDGFGIY